MAALSTIESLWVWAGGAVFVTALGATAWAYAVWFAGSGAGDGPRAIAVDTFLMTVFALHHSLFARDGAKQLLTRAVRPRLLRSVYVWIASALLIVVCLLWRPVGGEIYHVTGPAAWILAVVQLLGVGMIAKSVSAIHALELAGISPPRDNDALQMHGVYALVRHPLYLGWALLLFGAANMTGDRMTFAVLTNFYLVVAIPWEERALERAFGVSYRAYKQQVRWRMVPFVY